MKPCAWLTAVSQFLILVPRILTTITDRCAEENDQVQAEHDCAGDHALGIGIFGEGV
jgi:hypothetical protein